jgi:hypothetical protein
MTEYSQATSCISSEKVEVSETALSPFPENIRLLLRIDSTCRVRTQHQCQSARKLQALLLLLLLLLLSSSSSLSLYTFLTSQQFSRFSQQYGPTDQAFLIHCCAKNVLTIRHVLRITALCIRVYRAGRRLSGFKLSCDLFGIASVVEGRTVA